MSINSVKEDEKTVSIIKKATLVRLFSYLLSYKKQIVIVLFLMLGTVSISLINPLIIEHAINVNIAGNDINGLLTLGLFAVILNIIYVLFVKIRMYMMAKLSNSVLLKIRQELYSHIQTLSFSFFDSRPSGKILARIIGDVNSLKNVLSNSVTTLIPDFITICAGYPDYGDQELEIGSCLHDQSSTYDGWCLLRPEQSSCTLADQPQKNFQPKCLHS